MNYFRHLKNSYIYYLDGVSCFVVSFEKRCLKKKLEFKMDKVNHLITRINRRLFGRRYRKRKQGIVYFATREEDLGNTHFHFLIKEIPVSINEFETIFAEELLKVRYKKKLVFRKKGSWIDEVRKEDKDRLTNYMLKEVFQNRNQNFDRIMIPTANGSLSYIESDMGMRYIPKYQYYNRT